MLGAGDVFGKNVGVWRIAEALRDEACGRSAPTVHVEAGEKFAPWDDVVERWSDGQVHLWQAKSGATLRREEFAELVASLSRDHPRAQATLAVRINLRVPGVPSELGELARLLNAIRNGASINTEAPSPWEVFCVEVCEGGATAEAVCRRLSVRFLGGLDGPLESAREALLQVFEDDVVGAVLDRLRATVDRTQGLPVSVASLHDGPLHEFERRRRSPRMRRDTIRAKYLDDLAAALRSRRVLRGIRQDGARLSAVWIEPRLSTVSGEQFGADELASHFGSGEVHLILAPAGAGKTELLARCGAMLADEARSTGAPLPLLVSARSVEAYTDRAIAESAEAFARGISASIEQLLQAPEQKWILLIDGLDETECGAELVDRLKERFSSATFIVTARPTVGRALMPCVRFEVAPWTSGDAQAFTKAMTGVYPAAAEALQCSAMHAGALFERPLTASLAALLALNDRTIPASRAQLYRSAVSLLVQSWAEQRELADPWSRIGDDVRRLALEVVRGQYPTISSAQLSTLTRRVAGDRSVALEQAVENDFGLLVRSGAGYEFLLRGLAEYLAAELLEPADDQIIDAATHSWGSEIARHALGLVAETDPDRFGRLVRVILIEVGASAPIALHALRALSVTIRAATDVRDAARCIADELSRRSAEVLTEETSPWRGDMIANDIADLGKAGGPCWDAFEPEVIRILSDARDPEDHYRGLESASVSEWMLALLHCDPSVRCEAIRRLEAHMDRPDVIEQLAWMIMDTPAPSSWAAPPAIQAGLCLRKARRDGPVAEYLDLFRQASELPGQLVSVAAAIALRPDEHDPVLLARALRAGADAKYVPENVLQELAALADGCAALDANWPSWRSYRPDVVSPRPADARAAVPPSRWTRRRVARAAGGAIARSPRIAAVLGPTMDARARDLYLEALCEGGRLNPHSARDLLAIAPTRFPLLSPRAQDLLGSAVCRYPAVREQLLHAWPEFRRLVHRPPFPGRALEPLVVAGDEPATAVYADWLPRSYYAVSFYDGPLPDARVYARTEVATAARTIIEQVWHDARVGRADEDTKNIIFVAPGAAAAVLRRFSACWRGDERLNEGLLEWLESDDPNTRRAGISGLERAVLNGRQLSRFIAALKTAITASHDLHPVFTVAPAVMLAHAQNLGSSLIEEIVALAEQPGPASIAAACAARLIVSHDEARRLSAVAASRDVDIMTFEVLPHSELAALVALEPDTWVASVLRQGQFRGPLRLGLVLPIYRALPIRSKRDVALKLRALTEGHDLPWCVEGSSDEIYRPSDLVERLLFDSGAI